VSGYACLKCEARLTAKPNGMWRCERCELTFAEVSPNGDHADLAGHEIADAVGDYLLRFVLLPSVHVLTFLVLWVLHTHVFASAWATPYPRVTSAAPECGKSTLFDVLALVVRRAWKVVNPSTAVLYRKIEQDTPTLLLDQMDNIPLEDRRDMVAVLNGGYKQGHPSPAATTRESSRSFGSSARRPMPESTGAPCPTPCSRAP
jgi:hypothetical protein